jgi:hypothetical protein
MDKNSPVATLRETLVTAITVPKDLLMMRNSMTGLEACNRSTRFPAVLLKQQSLSIVECHDAHGLMTRTPLC